MAKRILLEKETGVIFNGETSYIPFLKDWRQMLEKNNLGVPFESQTHTLVVRLMENKNGKLYIEAWLAVKTDAEPLKKEAKV